MRRTIATLFALFATLVVVDPAAAGVVSPVSVSLPTVVLQPTTFNSGVYQWTVDAIPVGAPAEFSLGTKVGHCINFTAPPGGDVAATLRSAGDVDLRTGDPAGITTAGATDARVSQVKWLLLSSRARSLTGDMAAGHQLAIWRITNPSTGPTAQEKDIYDNAANAVSPSLAARLLSQAQALGARSNNVASASVESGGPSCAGTTRPVTVTGAPFSIATVKVSGPGSVAGLTDFSLDLGETGSRVLNVLGGTTGTVTVTASVKEAVMVQVAMPRLGAVTQKQDVATIESRSVAVSTTFGVVDCSPPGTVGAETPPPAPPKIPKTATVSLARLTIVKGADHAKITSGGIVHYTITVRNADEDAAVNVRTCDQLPDGMTYVSIGSARLRRGNACFTKASLASGASVTYKLVARVDVGATGTFVNHATTVADNAPSRSATASVRATPATRKPRNGVQGVVG